MNELKKKIEQGMTELKLSRSGLSKAIGHSRNYLSECLRVGVSTEKQGVIIGKIDWVLESRLTNPNSEKTEEFDISDFVGRAYHDQEVAKLKAEKMEIIQDVKNVEAHSLELAKENSELKEIRDGLVSMCTKREVKITDLQKANIDLMDELKGMKDVKNAWRFLAWVTLVVLLVFVCVGVVG